MTASSKLEILISPVAGKTMHLEEVADMAFAQGMLGPGAAIEPVHGTQAHGVMSVVAPLSGSITAVAAQGHAVSIRSMSGLEVLIHVGIDTAELDGKPFLVPVQVGDSVHRGDILLHADIEAITRSGHKPTVMVTIPSGAGIPAAQDEVQLGPRRTIKQGDPFLNVNIDALSTPTPQEHTQSAEQNSRGIDSPVFTNYRVGFFEDVHRN